LVKKGGVISAKKAGTAVITAKIKGTGYKAVCIVNVKSKAEKSDSVKKASTASADKFESSCSAVNNMKIGWCLGNSLDCYGSWISGNVYSYETAWGNPAITKELIGAVKEAGFNAVRIPVTYLDHMDSKGNVDKEWLGRVKEIVDYAYAEDMYCIINVHHDTGGGDEAWLKADKSEYENGMREKYISLWRQIGNYFKDYDEKLLFEGFNEILDSKASWNGSDNEAYEIVNKLNKDFVDTVRKTGGNNSVRNLIVNSYGASSAASQISGFRVPDDSAENHLIAEVHIYDPSGFCGGSDDTWDENDEAVLDKIFSRLNDKIIKAQGVPVIAGEFGTQDKFGTDEYEKERAEYAKYFVTKASEYGITCFWWDDGGSMRLFDRKTCEQTSPEVIKALEAAAK